MKRAAFAPELAGIDRIAAPAVSVVKLADLVDLFQENEVARGIPSVVVKDGGGNLAAMRSKPGVFTFRYGFFYRMGMDDKKFGNKVVAELKKGGFNATILDTGEHWAAFKGGAKEFSSQDSFFWAVAQVERDSEPTKASRNLVSWKLKDDHDRGDLFRVLKPITLGFDSDTQHPNPRSVKTFRQGDVLRYESTAENGLVWFTDSLGRRGMIQSSIRGLLSRDVLEPVVENKFNDSDEMIEKAIKIHMANVTKYVAILKRDWSGDWGIDFKKDSSYNVRPPSRTPNGNQLMVRAYITFSDDDVLRVESTWDISGAKPVVKYFSYGTLGARKRYNMAEKSFGLKREFPSPSQFEAEVSDGLFIERDNA